MKSREMKVSKNVTFTLTNVEVVKQMMDKRRSNFSQAMNIIITDWLEIRTALHFNKQQQQLDAKREGRFERMKEAKVIKQ